jgi:hypothetical protein
MKHQINAMQHAKTSHMPFHVTLPRAGAIALVFAAGGLTRAASAQTAPESASESDNQADAGSGEAATCPPPDGTRPDPALVNTDDFVLERFGLERVLGTLLEEAGVRRQSATSLFQRLWDTLDTRANAKFDGPHCDDLLPASINGFPVDCPRKEARLKESPPSVLAPVALVNRFDLHAADASDCGEYRIVYAMRPFAVDNRNFVNFEASLPNPRPELGIEGCRPVVEFWLGLERHDVATRRGRRELRADLERFYFEGLTGFAPAIHPSHYGLSESAACEDGEGAPARGQIRTNMFVDATEPTDTWQLRQFALARACDRRGCHLFFEPAPVGINPFPALFDASNPLPEAAELQAEFIGQIANLTTNDLARITLKLDPRFNAGQSTSSGFGDHLLVHAANGVANGERGFVDALRAELARLGVTDLGPQDIVERANTQTCAGCHQSSTSRPLSRNGQGEPLWPPTRPVTENTTGGFVHIDEDGFLSSALWCTFLPFRRSLLDEFGCNPESATGGEAH